MPKEFDVLINELKSSESLGDKNQILDNNKNVINFLNFHPEVKTIFSKLPDNHKYVLKILMSINQAENILTGLDNILDFNTKFKEFCETLLSIEDFYHPIGGLVGYHRTFINLLKNSSLKDNITLSEPEYFDLRKYNENIDEYIKIGLENLDKFAFILPMGGAGDRLKLFNKNTNEELPAAVLNFNGFTLIENIIRDIQALEYLYYKTFNKEILTPIVIMTSDEKNNHDHIISIFEENNWFKRDKKSFCFIKQLSVPLITQEGNWVLQSPLKLALKPSGHGVIWHLMKKSNAFDFLKSYNRSHAIIRQINNPIAGVDYLFLAFMGIGIKNKKAFGFSSCPRLIGYKEGVNVLREEKQKDGFLYNISNLEYTEFEKVCFDENISSDLNESKYPSNTNILFADLNEIEKITAINPFPGLTINLKTKVYLKDSNGIDIQKDAGRLESMMQNIADSIKFFNSKKIEKKDQKNLKTFLTLSERNKTISTTKNSFIEGKDFLETPQKCFYDVLSNYHDLLKNYCNIQMPKMPSIDDFFTKGPSFICNINPMLGPLYTIISKKINGGIIAQGSEIQLEIADLLMENINLDGSFLIETSLIRNSKKDFYNTSSCILKNVTIKNLGIDFSSKNIFWQNKINRKESFKIILGENSHLYATNIEFINNLEIKVPSNHKMSILKKNNKNIYKLEKI